MLRQTSSILPVSLSILVSSLPIFAHSHLSLRPLMAQPAMVSALLAPSDREQDGLVGPVRRVRTETAKVKNVNGTIQEGPRTLLETATYDVKGNKIDNAYYLAAGGSLTGKEVYKYDAKGNIIEMTLYNADGSVLSKEIYSYEYDAMGNWTKMLTSVAVVEGGKLTFEPTEVTYRTIAYYLEENVAKMMQPAAPAPAKPASASPASAGAANSVAKAPADQNAKPASTPATAKPLVAPATVAALGKGSAFVPPSNAPSLPTAVASGKTADGPVVPVDNDEPAKVVPKPPVKPISGGVLNGMAISLPKPVYPEIAKRARAAGTVTVEVVIDGTGKVISAKAISGNSLLHQAAVTAAYQARFSPTLLSGQPVKVSGVINYSFVFSQ
jgi:TonB family protein